MCPVVYWMTRAIGSSKTPSRQRFRALWLLCVPLCVALLLVTLVVPLSGAFPGSGLDSTDSSLHEASSSDVSSPENLFSAPSTRTLESEPPFTLIEQVPSQVPDGHISGDASGEPREVRVTIVGVGDILMHKAVIDGGFVDSADRDSTSGLSELPAYDFTRDFSFISPIVSEADLAICNFEGTLAGPPYSGFPSFSAPDEIADALYSSGFDIVGTANNHCIDKGFDGLKRTASVLRSRELAVVGTREDPVYGTDVLVNKDGIRIGVMCYTFETIGSEQTPTINGIPVPKGAEDYINSFNPYRKEDIEKDILEMAARVEKLRDQGADIICLSVHWGEEYQTKSAVWQQNLAQRLCDAGVDIIFGHHPHVLQEAAVLTSADGTHETVVFYSLGNFLHNMNFGTLGTAGKAQDSAIARVTIFSDGESVRIEKAEFIPTYVVRVTENGHMVHLIVPVSEATLRPEDFLATAQEVEASRKRILAILGACTGSEGIPISEAFI